MLKKIGRYEVIEELGRGSMGVVYKARDPVIGRSVAIKTIRLGDFSAPQQLEELTARLIREAQSAGVLSHPNIITIFDAGEEDGLSYIAMELVEGVSLEHLLERGQSLSEATILHIARQTADALGYAHQRGIVHRDIKPGNIMLTEDGRVKVADFGIAKVGSSKMTQTGMLLGSPSYMAPEHFLGQPLDGRSDIFALGVVLFELLTGQAPFIGENLGTLSYKIVHEDPVPPIQLKPAVSPGLNDLVVKALSRDPQKRFQTAAELGIALDTLIEKTSPGPMGTQAADGLRQIEAEIFNWREKPFATTRPVSILEEKQRSRRWLFLLSSLLIFAAATMAVALIFPDQFHHAVDVAKARAQEWIGRFGLQAPAGAQQQGPTENLAQDGDALQPAPTFTPQAQDQSAAEAPAQPTVSPIEEPLKSASTPTPPSQTVSPEDLSRDRLAIPTHGTLLVSSTPTGAQIVLNDKEDRSWVTPYTFQNLSPGRHSVDVKKAGYNTERKIIILSGSEVQRIHLMLAEPRGLLKVSSVPAGAQIYVDGNLRPEVTPATLKVSAGIRRILLRKEGYRDAEQFIEIQDNTLSGLNHQLAPLNP